MLVEGHEEDVMHVATHPNNPAIFVTACGSGKVRKRWGQTRTGFLLHP